MCSRFHDGQRVDAVGAARAQARAPGRTEEWVVAVGEAREEVRFGIVEGEGAAEVRYEHPLDAQAERRSARVAEVLVEDEHVRLERIARLRLGNESGISWNRSEDTRERRVAKQRLTDTAIGGSTRSENQPGDSRVVDSPGCPLREELLARWVAVRFTRSYFDLLVGTGSLGNSRADQPWPGKTSKQ